MSVGEWIALRWSCAALTINSFSAITFYMFIYCKICSTFWLESATERLLIPEFSGNVMVLAIIVLLLDVNDVNHCISDNKLSYFGVDNESRTEFHLYRY